MRVVSKLKIRSAIRLAITAVSAIAAGCSSPGAREQVQQPEQAQSQVQEQPGDIWRCAARYAYYREREAGQFPMTKVISGKLVFHSVSPGPYWASGASVHFMSVAADPDMSHGNGINAVVRDGETDRIDIFMVVDGERRPLGSYPVGAPVPFKVIFDDANGTVTLESGEFAMTAKPGQLLRPHFVMKCSGADVSFADFDSKI